LKRFFFFAILLCFQITVSARNLLGYETLVNMQEQKGQTFLSLMKNTIKPALDQYATEGFQVVDGKTVARLIRSVDQKVSEKAIRAAGDIASLKSLADHLNQEYEMITFYELPDAIQKAGFSGGRFDLSTFFALVSGGGVAVQFDQNNISYNVNYGTGEYEKDEMTGRSYGEAPKRLALDASDKHYLQMLENYVRADQQNIGQFYKTILQVLLNSDASGFPRISLAGQAVATDFLAVYIAEQDRHLMADLKSHPWDEALLEVTLLSAFHSGQETVMVMYGGELTGTTLQQAHGCSTEERKEKDASMIDYWQFSTSSDPANCRRSGINITRKDFRALGAMITEFQRQKNPSLISRIERRLGLRQQSQNLFADLSRFLINDKTPQQLDRETLKLADDFTTLLLEVRDQAEETTQAIVADR